MCIRDRYWGEVENPWESTAPTHYRSLTKTLQVNAEHAFNDRYKLYGTYAGDVYKRQLSPILPASDPLYPHYNY